MIHTETAPYPSVALTHPGMSGKNNEDRFAVTAFRLSTHNATPVILAVLSDGIGGHRAGEVAAEIAVERISQRVAHSRLAHPTALLKEAVIEASEEISRMAQSDDERKGMGATCVAALIISRRMYAVTVGDSRLYLMRAGGIRQLSTDHTWIQEAIEAGLLQPDDANGHPNAHVIRRYLGSPTPPQVDHRLRLSDSETDLQAEDNQGMILMPGDRILLCSDGLTDLVDEDEILGHFQRLPQEEAAQALIELANTRGGHDNITLVSIEMPQKTTARTFSLLRAAALGCLTILVLGALFTGMVFGWGFFFGNDGRPAQTPTIPILLTDPLPVALTPDETRPPTITLEPAPPIPDLTGTPTPAETADPGAATITPWPTNTIENVQ
ncbi:MAG TPA: protein phosphatase 2C domain-containing protein [Levilinea sp.]|nr:protein phosphatase 2C domain-containing protein [Levilinea sp.]